MSLPYFEHGSIWVHALRQLMNFPASGPYAVSCCTSAARDADQAAQLADIARDMRRDLIHLTFDNVAGTAAPSAVSLVVRQGRRFAWLPHAQIYAATEGAPVELLVGGRRWYMAGGELREGKSPPAHQRRGGEEIAMRRWRAAAASTAPVTYIGSVWVPPGGRFADAIPQERLRVAA